MDSTHGKSRPIPEVTVKGFHLHKDGGLTRETGKITAKLLLAEAEISRDF